MTEIIIGDLTEGKIDGHGIYDVLMAANKIHIQNEFNAGRINAQNYSTVYLGMLDTVMSTSLSFLMNKAKIGLEADLLAQQIELAKVQLKIAEASLRKVDDEILQIQAQTALITQQKITEIQQELVLQAQECKLKAEFDLTMKNVTRTGSEIDLLVQKVTTEKAQTQNVGIDDNSVVGRQKALYFAQTEGFARDAEQKTAKAMIDTWTSRRVTDEGTVADSTNKLSDVYVGRAVEKMLAGVGA